MAHSAAEIEALVREEMRLTADESHAEAWADGVCAGIEPEIIAESAIETALSELLHLSGEAATVALIDKMRAKLLSGEMELIRTCH